MSEIKRAPLIPLGPQKESDKSPKEPRKSVRISVVLPESTEDTCPEYNYKDELAAAKKRIKYKEIGGTANGLNKFDEFDDDDDVKRIARQMEEKYGTGTSLNKKKRKGRKDDYADIGMGYDESDSFIDNTDGYDEMIPQNVTTLHGGFYINSGALEFKTDDEAESDISSSSSDDEGSGKTASRKRIIESSDETDRENKTETVDNSSTVTKKRKLQNGGNGMQQSLKKKLLAQNKIYIKKRRLLDPDKKTVKELLREKREDLNMTIPEELKLDSIDEDQKEKKNMSISNVTDVIESVVKASTGDTNRTETNQNTPTKAVVNSTSDGESSHDNTRAVKLEVVKLPENLSPDISSVITAIKKSAELNSDPKNIFTSDINILILRLERKCKCLGKPSKMKVYEHLATFLKCKTETLTRRAKSLVLDDEQKKLKNLLSGLKSEINNIMPSLLESYEKESQRIIQKKFSHESVDNEENKCLRMPKRRFQWNEVTKKLLKDILILKKRSLLFEGKSKDTLDAQMTTFLKTEIQVLWPDGWMSMNALNKIYTTYADPKRLLNNSLNSTSSNTIPTKSSSSNSNPIVKNLPQSFNNSNLSITPIVPASKSETSGNKILSVTNEVTVSKTYEPSKFTKTLPETSQPCDISPASPKKELEGKLKVKPSSELLKPPVSNHVRKDPIIPISDDSVIYIDSDGFNPMKKSDDNYCQVIDLSDKTELKKEVKSVPKKETSISPMISEHVSKHHELSITPTYPKVESKPKTSCAGDDIFEVMENLKVLQKMSSPKKSEPAQTSSAVSVIAVNKSFAPKTTHEASTMQRYDYNKSEYNTSFQDEFQKQLFSALNQFSSNSNKSYNSTDRYPHISNSGPSMVTGDKYYQNANNNYPQSSNGHKSSTSVQQTAAAPKSQQK
ncbi:yemanuclein isoform X2 [Tribolium madens]|uniref:yemanuclein isoform X2 n=1 Tax=Tribolium madens TaxID=41895 RepID=UPI001CF742EE|nr:yemanuclein isoform X2 [Tribolium madens]